MRETKRYKERHLLQEYRVKMAHILQSFFLKGYEVHGIKRRSSLFNTQRIDHL